jgi:hypothetical protein
MPDRTISILSASALALLACYLGLMVTTVVYATMQTDLASSMRATESEIAALEDRYYDAVAALDASNPAAYGLVKPSSVAYAELSTATALSRR